MVWSLLEGILELDKGGTILALLLEFGCSSNMLFHAQSFLIELPTYPAPVRYQNRSEQYCNPKRTRAGSRFSFNKINHHFPTTN